jgi:hypothetical protein
MICHPCDIHSFPPGPNSPASLPGLNDGGTSPSPTGPTAGRGHRIHQVSGVPPCPPSDTHDGEPPFRRMHGASVVSQFRADRAPSALKVSSPGLRSCARRSGLRHAHASSSVDARSSIGSSHSPDPSCSGTHHQRFVPPAHPLLPTNSRPSQQPQPKKQKTLTERQQEPQ